MLFQQYVISAYCSVEQIINEYLSGLYDAMSRGDCNKSDVGIRFTSIITLMYKYMKYTNFYH